MPELTILGAGGHGRVVADIAQLCGYDDLHFLDDAFPALSVSGLWPVTGKSDAEHSGNVALGIGNNVTRMRLLDTLSSDPVTLIHPSAVISTQAQIGAGSVICAGAVIGPFSVVGRGCIVNTNASLDHDCTLSDGVHISPGVAVGGGVRIGARSWIGIGASICEYLSIGADVMVGAGAAVTGPVRASTRVGGVPAKEF